MIRSLYAARGFEQALSGTVISSTGFTSDARVCAKNSGIELIDVCSLMPIGLEHRYEAVFLCEEKDMEHMRDIGSAKTYILRLKNSILTPRMEFSIDRKGFQPLKDGQCCIVTKRPHILEFRTLYGNTLRFSPRTSKDVVDITVSVRNGKPHVEYKTDRYHPASVNSLP